MTDLVVLSAAVAIAIAVGGLAFILTHRKRSFRRDLEALQRSQQSGRRAESAQERLKDRHAVDARDETGRTGLLKDRKPSRHSTEIEEEEARLEALRRLQRAEKIREAAEQELLDLTAPDAPPVLTPEEERLKALREFQRAEKIREAAEEQLEQETPTIEVEPKLETVIAQEVINLRKEEVAFEPKKDPAYVSMMIARAQDLIRDFNHQFGWNPGEGSIADRLFNTDVESILGNAQSTGQVDFKLERVVQVLGWYARANTGGRNKVAQVMATRVVLGAGKLNAQELTDLDLQRRLFGDDFATAAKFVDQMSVVEERNAAKRLGRVKDRAPDRKIEKQGPTLSR